MNTSETIGFSMDLDPDDLAILVAALYRSQGRVVRLQSCEDADGRTISVDVWEGSVIRARFPTYPVRMPAVMLDAMDAAANASLAELARRIGGGR